MYCNSLLQYVQEDVRKYAGTRRFVKAGLVERMAVKKVSPDVLHPNPDDETVVANNGKQYGFNVYQLDQQDEQWAQSVMDRVYEIKRRENVLKGK